MAMLPRPSTSIRAGFETYNDLPVHPATMQQIFHPTSESRHFTREDAAKVLDPDLLSADARIPHPALVTRERDKLQGFSRHELLQRQLVRNINEDHEAAIQEKARLAAEQRRVKKIAPAKDGGHGGRWEWHFRNISVQSVGKDGRSPRGVGWRYGVPHQDRKRAQVKIPTQVL